MMNENENESKKYQQGAKMAVAISFFEAIDDELDEYESGRGSIDDELFKTEALLEAYPANRINLSLKAVELLGRPERVALGIHTSVGYIRASSNLGHPKVNYTGSENQTKFQVAATELLRDTLIEGSGKIFRFALGQARHGDRDYLVFLWREPTETFEYKARNRKNNDRG